MIIIGDIHGRNFWKKIANQEDGHFVFVGDYFDSFDISGNDQIQNFLDIIEFSKNHKVTLLHGNHDFLQYVIQPNSCSGFQHLFAPQIRALLQKYKHLFKTCIFEKGWLISHAGVSKTWCGNNNITWETGESLAEQINNLWEEKPNQFLFTPERYSDMYGDTKTQTPLWIRPKVLVTDSVPYNQIVGHTAHKGVTKLENIYIVDTFSNEYLTLPEEIRMY